jgi:hypothetical protein
MIVAQPKDVVGFWQNEAKIINLFNKRGVAIRSVS